MDQTPPPSLFSLDRHVKSIWNETELFSNCPGTNWLKFGTADWITCLILIYSLLTSDSVNIFPIKPSLYSQRSLDAFKQSLKTSLVARIACDTPPWNYSPYTALKGFPMYWAKQNLLEQADNLSFFFFVPVTSCALRTRKRGAYEVDSVTDMSPASIIGRSLRDGFLLCSWTAVKEHGEQNDLLDSFQSTKYAFRELGK